MTEENNNTTQAPYVPPPVSFNWTLTHDNKPVFTADTPVNALGYIRKHHSYSWEHGLQHEGYGLIPADNGIIPAGITRLLRTDREAFKAAITRLITRLSWFTDIYNITRHAAIVEWYRLYNEMNKATHAA
jgi:hypothetical protein